MPFMKGHAPIRRTMQFLEAGKLVLKDRIKVVTVNYNTHGEHHQGARDFVFWYLPQIQYKNPNVQVATFKNMTPSPFIKAYYDSGQQMLIDIHGTPKEDVLKHLVEVIGKSKEVLDAEATQKEKKDNPANFGYMCDRHCICELPGQVPCPGTIPVPQNRRGKFKYQTN